MEPFVVICTTCRSRLRVRDPAKIGQIVNCPKCNSLVSIEPPHKVTVEPEDVPPADSSALTKDGIPAAVAPSDEPAAASGNETASSTHAGSHEETSAIDGGATDDSSDDQEPVPSSAAPGEPPNDAPLLPDHWTSPGTSRARNYLLIVFAGLTSTIVAVLLFLAFLHWQNKQPASNEPLADAQSVDAQVAGDADTADDATSGASPSGDSDDQDAAAEGPNDVSQSGAAGPDDVGDDGAPGNQPDQSMPSPGDETAVADNRSDAPGSSTTPTETAPSAGAASSSPGNQPTSDPSVRPTPDAGKGSSPPPLPKELTAPTDDTADENHTASAEELLPNERLRQFAPMLNWRVQPTLPDVNVPLGPPPLTAEELGITETSADQALPDIDWTQRAQVVLPGVLFDESITVAEAINLWTHVSGVPTVIDFLGWQAANLSLHRPMPPVKLTNVTVDAAVREIAAALGVEWTIAEARYLLLRPGQETIAEVLPERVPVDDLLGDQPPEALLKCLAELVPGSDQAWKVTEGQLQRDPAEITSTQWFVVIQLLESWRLIVGKPLRVTSYDQANVDVRLPDPSQVQGLDQAVQEISPQERPVGQLLSMACRSASIDCWIDWPNTMKVGVGPTTTMTVVTYRRPIRRILREVLTKNDLVLAVLAPNALWVTTPRGYRGSPRWFAVPTNGRTPQQIELDLIQFSPVSDDGVRRIRVVLTPDNSVAFVLCCWPTIDFH